MKIMKKISVLILPVMLLSACHSPKEKALGNISKMEAADSVYSPKAIADLKGAYLDFALKYPDDEQSPEFIFKAAQRCNATADHEEAIRLFQRIIEKYPRHKLCEEAYFLQGYIYENSLNNLTKAKEVYTTFLQKYPKSELAEDARLALENLGKSPEEIFENFKHKRDSMS